MLRKVRLYKVFVCVCCGASLYTQHVLNLVAGGGGDYFQFRTDLKAIPLFVHFPSIFVILIVRIITLFSYFSSSVAD